MRISVITCTRDSARWLAENIASVQAQTHDDVEHVFVDGGSTDDTLAMIAAVPGRVQLVRDVVGLSESMNAGAHAATGEVLMHVHGDDLLADRDALTWVAQAFERTGAGWLYGQCRSDRDGTVRSTPSPAWNPRRLRTRGNQVPHPAVAIRKSLFEEVGGFDTTLRCCMDYDLWLRLSTVSTPAVLDEYLAVFRYHAAAISTKHACTCLAEDRMLRMRFARGPLEQLVARLSLWRETRSLRRQGLLVDRGDAGA